MRCLSTWHRTFLLTISLTLLLLPATHALCLVFHCSPWVPLSLDEVSGEFYSLPGWDLFFLSTLGLRHQLGIPLINIDWITFWASNTRKESDYIWITFLTTGQGRAGYKPAQVNEMIPQHWYETWWYHPTWLLFIYISNQFSLKTRSLSPNVLLGLFQSWEQTKRNTARLSNGLSRKWEEELWSLYGINGIGALNSFLCGHSHLCNKQGAVILGLLSCNVAWGGGSRWIVAEKA